MHISYMYERCKMQTEGPAEMEEVHCVRKDVEAFYVISLMPLMMLMNLVVMRALKTIAMSYCFMSD